MDEKDPRFKIAAARRMLAREGCESQVAGHVSVRDDQDERAFWVTPFEYFDETTPDRVIKVDFDLNLLEGNCEPSPAISFHAEIYQGRPDAKSIIHIHSHWATVFATLGQPMGQYAPSSVLFYDEQAFYLDDGVQRSVDGERMVAALGKDKSVLWMRNHGPIILADSLEKCTILAMMTEKCAQYHADAVALGGLEAPVEEVVRAKGAYHQYFLPQMWEANYRRLRKSDPDLFAYLDQ
jgi:L-fuculose-phosphate aldolase